MKKEEQIRMLLPSEQYSEEQLDKMLEDSHIPAPDVDKEWQRFKTRTQAQQPWHIGLLAPRHVGSSWSGLVPMSPAW